MNSVVKVLALLVLAFNIHLAHSEAVIPMRVQQSANGSWQFIVQMQIGRSAPFDAIIDTGSTGVRVFPDVLSNDDYVDTGSTTQEIFGGSRTVAGTIATGQISVGGVSIPDMQPFELIKSISCSDGRSSCEAFAPPYRAIIGLGLRGAATVPNPLSLVGDGVYIIKSEFPDLGTSSIIVNPSGAETAGFFSIQLPKAGRSNIPFRAGRWSDNMIKMCLILKKKIPQLAGKQVCSNTIFDSGAGTKIHVSGKSNRVGDEDWPAGTNVTMRLKSAGQHLDIPFVIGQRLGMDVFLPADADQSKPNINTGMLPFLLNAILYNAKSGIIGIRPNVPQP